MSVDRLPRITADSSLGIRPSLEDTRWLIAQVRLGRHLLASAEEAIRQLVAAQQVTGPVASIRGSTTGREGL